MTTRIALLRGVNVGGKTKIAMADLRAMLADLGFGEPRTLLQSGNAVFRSDKLTGSDLERLLETETEKHLGLKTDFFVRTPEEWREVPSRTTPSPTRPRGSRSSRHHVPEQGAGCRGRGGAAGRHQGPGDRARRGPAGVHHLSGRDRGIEADDHRDRKEARAPGAPAATGTPS